VSSEVDICNLSLSHLGDDATVSSINPPEGSAQAEHCRRFYPIARRAMIAMHPWNMSTRRQALAEVADDPPDSWEYAYAVPNDCIKVFAVLAEGSLDDTAGKPYVIEGNSAGVKRLYTNTQNATLRYAVDVTDTSRFDILFELALSRLLASFLAGPIIKGTEGAKIAAAHRDFFDKKELPDAKAADANQHGGDAYTDAVPAPIAARA